MSGNFKINDYLQIPFGEIDFSSVRAEGPGGQHVNKTSSAVELRFHIEGSSLPDVIQQRLLKLSHHNITPSGDILITAQSHRSQHQNRDEALERLRALILLVTKTRKKRKKTKPSKGAVEKRIRTKKKRADVKKMRKKVDY